MGGNKKTIAFLIAGGVALVLLVVAGLTFARSTSEVASDSVAEIEGDQISLADYEKLARVANGVRGTGLAVNYVPDPPDFTKCAAARAQTEKASHAELVDACRQSFKRSNPIIMNSLIRERWYAIYAQHHKIKIAPGDVQKVYQSTRRRFPDKASYEKFLSVSGLTQEDVMALARSQTLENYIRGSVEGNVGVSADEVRAAYRDQRKRKTRLPRTRDAQMIFTRERADAVAARQAIEAGRPWASVAKEYLDPGPISSPTGLVTGINKETYVKNLSEAIFSAQLGDLTGPVAVKKGFYVFRVNKAHGSKRPTLDVAAPGLRAAILARKKAEAWQKFKHAFAVEWRAHTVCADAYKVELCRNGPKLSAGA